MATGCPTDAPGRCRRYAIAIRGGARGRLDRATRRRANLHACPRYCPAAASSVNIAERIGNGNSGQADTRRARSGLSCKIRASGSGSCRNSFAEQAVIPPPFSFPSWTSSVRIRSPALVGQPRRTRIKHACRCSVVCLPRAQPYGPAVVSPATNSPPHRRGARIATAGLARG